MSTHSKGKASEMKHYAGKAVFSAAVGHALDGLDLMILSFALSGIMATFAVDNTTAGMLTSITLAGAFLGGLIFGKLADKYGRIKVLTYSVIFFGVFTLGSAFAPNFEVMALCRFLAGLGIGAEFGLGMAIAAEVSSPENRAKSTSAVGLGFQVGVLCASLSSAPIIAAFGWRGLFVVGFIPAIIAIIIRAFVPEPPIYEEHKASGKAHGKLSDLFATPERVKFSIIIIILCTVQNAGYFGIMTWLPKYLNSELGLSLTSTGLWTAVTVLGMMIGISVFGFLADKAGRRPAFWTFQVGAAHRRLLYGHVRQRHDRRLRHPDCRAVPDRNAWYRANRAVQRWPFHRRRFRSGGYSDDRCWPWLRLRHRLRFLHLCSRFHRDVLHSREEGRYARIATGISLSCIVWCAGREA